MVHSSWGNGEGRWGGPGRAAARICQRESAEDRYTFRTESWYGWDKQKAGREKRVKKEDDCQVIL